AAPVLTRIAENRPAARFEIEDLEEWLTRAGRPLLVARPRPKTNSGSDAFAAYANSVPVDPEALLAEMAIGSVHDIHTKAIASLVARGEDGDVIDQKVLDATKRAYEKGGATRAWNWDKELRAIQKSRAKFETKLLAAQTTPASVNESAAGANSEGVTLADF